MQERREKPVVALVAHDKRKPKMLEWVNAHRELLKQCVLVGTEGTAKNIRDILGLEVKSIGHGPLGGDISIAYKVLKGEISLLVFFIDTQTPHGHEHDIQSLIRAAVTKNILFALNAQTAEVLVRSLVKKR